MNTTSSRLQRILCLSALLALAGCGLFSGSKTPVETSAGKSAIFTLETVMSRTANPGPDRPGTLLGIYISDYLAHAILLPVKTAMLGIQAQAKALEGHEVIEPDYQLLSAFGDALQVDVTDLLNRSANRQETLDTYITSLTNAATRGNERYKELSVTLEQQKIDLRAAQNTETTVSRDLQTALHDKNFDLAGQKQKEVSEAQKATADLSQKEKQTESVVGTLEQLLTVFGQRKLAIEKNREALINGTTITDVPGVEDLKILQQGEVPRTTTNRATGKNDFNSLFDFSHQFDGL